MQCFVLEFLSSGFCLVSLKMPDLHYHVSELDSSFVS